MGSEEWVFECNRWLDVGEDDGKTIREIYAETESKALLGRFVRLCKSHVIRCVADVGPVGKSF